MNAVPEKLGCGNAYQGGACNTGMQVGNCIFPNAAAKGIKNCA